MYSNPAVGVAAVGMCIVTQLWMQQLWDCVWQPSCRCSSCWNVYGNPAVDAAAVERYIVNSDTDTPIIILSSINRVISSAGASQVMLHLLAWWFSHTIVIYPQHCVPNNLVWSTAVHWTRPDAVLFPQQLCFTFRYQFLSLFPAGNQLSAGLRPQHLLQCLEQAVQ